jgi:Spy/CpxP family protein refolding chaperone
MYTRRLILAAVLVLAASVLVVQAASALGMQQGVMPGMQGRGPGMGMHREMGEGMMSLDQLKADLNLTPDQVSKIQAIRQSARTQRQAIMADRSLTPDVRRTRMFDIAKSTHAQIMAVLTPAQQAKLKELRSQRKAEVFNKMSTALGLTADQQAQIKAIRDKEKADMKAVLANTSLAPADRVAQIKQIRSAAKEQIRGLLTPEQQAKWDALRKDHKAGRAGAGPRVLQPKRVQPKVQY